MICSSILLPDRSSPLRISRELPGRPQSLTLVDLTLSLLLSCHVRENDSVFQKT
ncbi:MAG: hypothetical protein KFF72_15110 [Arthrospira sp. SH-MAG29]|nr:hypothetical protein [Arthrospira sp. SH-MAG29]MBS0017652.1 hypothetical protein [Arthrospira sp. SH-MAG29]